MLVPWRALFYQMVLNASYDIVKASLCLGGHDIFATVKENSPMGEFIANITIVGEPGANSIRLCLTGENAGWFYLEGRTIRLNTSFSRGLDREVQGSILLASLTCYEEDTKQNEYRVMVEILNENDNMPHFLEKTIQPRSISELTAVNSVVFSVKAKDADGDTITYVIDKLSPDSSYFRIDLPNSGIIILNKPLDFETKTQLQVDIYAVEMNTIEKYNTTATVRVSVLDGDDQYPQFLPCSPISEHTICTNPLYVANISEEQENSVLHFSPGPIHAEDGDKDILTPLTYTILSGDDNGRFTINRETGEITLRRRVENRLMTSSFKILIMASQVNDPKKYTVTTAQVRVVAENRFPPYFNKTTYKGFIIENSSPATLVSTYGNEILIIQATDRDFRDGINPKITYALHPVATSTKLYHITEDGILIAKATHLSAFDRHILEVVATDQESGDIANATVDIEVLQKGQAVPRSPFGEERLFGDVNVGIAGGLAAVLLLLAISALCLLLRLLRRWRHRQDPVDRGSVALGKHPNVVKSGRPVTLLEEAAYHNEAFTDHEASNSSGLTGKPGLYMKRGEMPLFPGQAYGSRGANRSMPLSDMLPILRPPEPLLKMGLSSVMSNGRTPEAPAYFADQMANKVKESLLGEHNRVKTRADILMTTSQQAVFSTAAEVASAENTQEILNMMWKAGDSCEPKISSGTKEKYTQTVADRSSHRGDTGVDVLMPTSQQATFNTLLERTQERQDTENVGTSCTGQRGDCRLSREEDDGSKENQHMSMHSVFCVRDDSGTITDEEQIHKGNSLPRLIIDLKDSKDLQKEESSEWSEQKTRTSNEAPSDRLISSPSMHGLLYFVEDPHEL